MVECLLHSINRLVAFNSTLLYSLQMARTHTGGRSTEPWWNFTGLLEKEQMKTDNFCTKNIITDYVVTIIHQCISLYANKTPYSFYIENS